MSATHPTHSELLKFASGSLRQSERAQLYAHLEGCAQCRRVVENVSNTPPAGPNPFEPSENVTRQVKDLLIGATLGEYRIVERLGQGGMGVLYRAVQPLIGKEVAIKVVLAEIASDPTVAQRMIDEARSVNAARHQNIVDIFAFGQLPDGRPYMVMELLHGQSLAELLATEQRLPPERALVVLDQCFAGLEVAHAVGVIHRDLKPENIFVDQRGAEWKVTLLDFGLATRTGQHDEKLTQPGTVVGTPGFMAPEQVRGADELSPQTDVYAMGVVAWTILVGREPFAGGSIVEVMHRHLKMKPPSIRKEVPAVPEALEALVLRMLSKEPDQRPTDREVRKTIAALAGRSAPGAPVLPTAAAPRSRAPLFAAGGVVVASLLAVTAWSFAREPEAPPLPKPIPAGPVAKPSPVLPGVVADAGAGPPQETPATDAGSPASRPKKLGTDTAKTWHCERIISISPIVEAAVGPWLAFEINFSDEAPLLVSFAPGRPGLKRFRSVHQMVRQCKGKDLILRAAHTRDHLPWVTRALKKGEQDKVFSFGIQAESEDLSITPLSQKPGRR